jgi:hypothetical protein
MPGKVVGMAVKDDAISQARDQVDDLRGIVQSSFQRATHMEPLRLQHLLRDIDRKLMEISQVLKSKRRSRA